jgi:uncharacterized glyoxalase superfamily protein PhnB
MKTNRSVPNCTVIPELPYPDLNAAVQWLSDAFGFRPRLLIADHRAQIHVGDGAIILLGDPPQAELGRCSVLVRVEDVDAHCARARAAGATIVREPASYPFGERQYTCTDHAGHRWTFSQSIADVHPNEWGGTAVEL